VTLHFTRNASKTAGRLASRAVASERAERLRGSKAS
jgi:hypothetical protein